MKQKHVRRILGWTRCRGIKITNLNGKEFWAQDPKGKHITPHLSTLKQVLIYVLENMINVEKSHEDETDKRS